MARNMLLRYATTANGSELSRSAEAGDHPFIVAPEGQKASSAGARIQVAQVEREGFRCSAAHVRQGKRERPIAVAREGPALACGKHGTQVL